MSDQWIRAGGSAWLAAVLYDAPPKPDILFDDEPLGAHVDVTNTELRDALDRVLATRHPTALPITQE